VLRAIVLSPTTRDDAPVGALSNSTVARTDRISRTQTQVESALVTLGVSTKDWSEGSGNLNSCPLTIALINRKDPSITVSRMTAGLMLLIVFILTQTPLYATKLVTYRFRGETRIGAWTPDGIIDLHRAYREMLIAQGKPRAGERAQALVPSEMLAFLEGEGESMEAAQQAIEWASARRRTAKQGASKTDSDHLREAGVWFEHSEVRLAPPIPNPPHLLAVALNYRAHSAEIKIDLPQYPNVFTKEGKVIGPGESIEIPGWVKEPDYEAELAVVIGKRGRAVSRESAYEYIAGYMTFNDVTSRDYQFRVSQYTLGKSLDTFSAMGPFLVLRDEIPDPHRLRITARIGQEILQDSNTSFMIFPVAELIAQMSQLMTLEPGTVIATGTPSGVGHARKPPRYLRPGETILVEVEGLGVLENKVVQQNPP